MNYDPAATSHRGLCGTAQLLRPPARPDAAETVCLWLITAPCFAMFWSQYFLLVVRLRDDVPGFPPPKRKFDGATHELIVTAIDPTGGPTSQESLDAQDWQAMPYLSPINVAWQFEASDDEMLHLADLAVQGVVHGALNPETSDSPGVVREQWLGSLIRTLAHIRGEEHAP